jgi:ABC-2 type transport system permease protein
MHAFRAGFKLQLRTTRAYPDSFIPFITAPLFAVIFIAIMKHADREDLTAYAAVAPVFIALWWLALFQAGWVIDHDRWAGTLEPLVAAPARFSLAVLGRIVGVAVLGLVSFAEVWLVARLIYGESIRVHHFGAFVLTVAATLAAMAGTAVVMSSIFVLTRNAATFSNSASYPFYVLGGILVPISFLPWWIRPVSGVVFLSWSADLLRSTLEPGPIDDLGRRLAMIAFLGACGFALGAFLLEWILHRVRGKGELGHT